MSLKRSVLIPLFLFVLFLVETHTALAANGSSALGGLETAAKGAGLVTSLTAPQIIGGLISAVIGLSGLVFVVLFVYAGITYMTAMGDVDKVKKSKGTMIQAVIGIIVVIAAYAISTFVFQQLVGAAGG